MKQIKELNERLSECSAALLAAQQTAQAAQALHAGTIQQQLTDGAADLEQEQPQGRCGVRRKERLVYPLVRR